MTDSKTGYHGGLTEHSLQDYHARANRHRPTDPQSIARVVRQLESEGLKPRDIGEALRIPLETVINILGEKPS